MKFTRMVDIRSIYKRSYSIVFLFFILVKTNASIAIPSNIKQSYNLEILRNQALIMADFEYMAAGIIASQKSLGLDKAIRIAQKMSERELRKLIIQPFFIEYYEIPLLTLENEGKIYLQSLRELNHPQIFTHNGDKWVRWFVHPLHDADYLKKKYPQYSRQGRFKAHLTASRSLIIEDLLSKDYFSLKSSLSMAQGPFKSKRYALSEGRLHFWLSDLFSKDNYLADRIFLEQSLLSFKNGHFDEAQLVRSLEPYHTGHKIQALVTLFDPRVSIPLAQKNGYGANWKKFLAELVIPDLGHTVGYIYEKYGLSHNSLHSQNIMVEFTPEGAFIRTRIRDLDFDADPLIFGRVIGSLSIQPSLQAMVFSDHGYSLDFSIFNGVGSPFEQSQKKDLFENLFTSFQAAVIFEIGQMRGSQLSLSQITEIIQNIQKVYLHSCLHSFCIDRILRGNSKSKCGSLFRL